MSYGPNAVACPCLALRYRFHCSAEEFNVLRSYLSATVIDGPDVGWEEYTEVSWPGMKERNDSACR